MNRLVKPPSVVECFVMAGIAAILISILMTGPQWASDGSIQLSVQVMVFALDRHEPIEGARVMLFRGGIVDANNQPKMQRLDSLTPEFVSVTDMAGSTIIEHAFSTGASHRRPTTRAFLDQAWVQVEAEGFEGVAVPIRHESQPVAALKRQSPIVVQIGLEVSKLQ